MAAEKLMVTSVAKSLPAWRCGIRKGDEVLSVDGIPMVDEIDFRFATAQHVSRIEVRRDGKRLFLTLSRPHNAETGVTFADRSISRCSNHCLFCFIDQMPPGLRASLYVKDEDPMHSFVNGNYVTLSAMTRSHLERICRLGLSPLYISVHATNPAVRRRMLCNRNAGDIMEQLKYLEKNGIRFHAQIVVCPGFNDGPVLANTLRDLCGFRRGLLSVAVVPVGLTKYRNRALMPVERFGARRICSAVAKLDARDQKRVGRRRLFCADELFITARLAIPPRRYYEDYPQIENGVGLVRQLLDEWEDAKRSAARGGPRGRGSSGKRPVLLVTSESAHRYVARVARELPMFFPNLRVRTVAAKNEFFGGHVTVAGLLTACDVIRTVRDTARTGERVILPGVMFNAAGHTLDGYSLKRIAAKLRASVYVADSINDVMRIV
jgi:putative radical SAM enzyme (TIGR03279 family)